MRRTIRTTAIVLGAVAATGLGLTTAVAASDTTPTTGTSTAQPPPSYQITSSTITVPVDPLDYPTTHGLCAADFHVAGDWQDAPTPGDPTRQVYAPSVHANGDSDIYVVGDPSVDQNTQNGTDSNGRPYYQGLNVTLGNHSWLHAKSGSFTWTCEPN